MNIMKIVMTAFVLFAFFGCANKNKEVYNKPALYWYGEIVKKIKDFNLEEADNLYTSLSSEHISSPLIPEAMNIG